LSTITKEQREKLIENLSEKFNQLEEFVRKNLEIIGVPILKENTGLIIKNPQRWF